MEGFYAMHYIGSEVSGHAVLVMKDGLITGADSIGGTLDGTFEEVDDYNFKISLTFQTPAGSTRMNGRVVEREAPTQNFTKILPKNFSNGYAIGIQTSEGPINVVFKKLRDTL